MAPWSERKHLSFSDAWPQHRNVLAWTGSTNDDYQFGAGPCYGILGCVIIESNLVQEPLECIAQINYRGRLAPTYRGLFIDKLLS